MEDGDAGCLIDSFAPETHAHGHWGRRLRPRAANMLQSVSGAHRCAPDARLASLSRLSMRADRASEQAELFECTPVPLILLDGNLRIQRVNRRAALFLAECALSCEAGVPVPHAAAMPDAGDQAPSAVHATEAAAAVRSLRRTCDSAAGRSASRNGSAGKSAGPAGLLFSSLAVAECVEPLAAWLSRATDKPACVAPAVAAPAASARHLCALRGFQGAAHWVELHIAPCSSLPDGWLLSFRPSLAPLSVEPGVAAEEACALSRRLLALAAEPLALVTRSQVLSANEAFCRRVGIVMGASCTLPLSTLFGAEDQVLLLDEERHPADVAEQPAWSEVALLGAHSRRVQARAVRIEAGAHSVYLLSLAEIERCSANDQALRRLERWAAGQMRGRGEQTPPLPRASSPRALARKPRSSIAASAAPSRSRGLVHVNQVVMRAVGVGGALGSCRVVCRMQPGPALALDEGQLLLAVRCLLEHAVQPLAAGRNAPSALIVRSESDARGVHVWVEPQFDRNPAGACPQDSGALMLSQRAIHESGGWLQVEAQPNGSLRYGLHLPSAPAVRETPRGGDRGRPRESRRVATATFRVLVIDGDRKVAGMLRRGLSRLGQVESIDSGHEAIALLTLDGLFDVILCDVNMADDAGVQVFRWLSTYRPSLLPRLLLISHGNYAGATPQGVPIVHRPFDATALTHVVRSLAGSVEPIVRERSRGVAAS